MPTEGGEKYHRNDQEPFSLPWVNSCYQQSLLPNAPWHKLEQHVAKALAGRVEKQFSHPQRKEMLLELLGPHFIDSYLSHVERNPQVLDASHMNGEEYNRLKVEATSWLNNQMYKAVKDTGMQAVINGPDNDSGPLPPEFGEFLQHTFTVVTNGLDRELFRQEEELKEEKEKELREPKKKKKGGKQTGNSEIFKVPAPSRLKALSTQLSHSSTSSIPKPSSAQLRGLVHTVQGDPPPLWGNQSDCIGAGVVSLLQRDPRKFEHVAGRLHGRQLPGSLRAYMWADVLLKGERRRMKEVYAEKMVREKFARAVTRGLTELKIKKPTESPINGLIQNAVIETYGKSVSMVPYKHIDHVKEASRALNVLYVYDRSYEPYLVFWLFPLQIAFRDREAQAKDHGEHVLELAMYLDLLNANCFPPWPQVFAVAERVMQKLQEDDPEFHDHLKHIATISVQGSPKEFLVQMIHQEREKAEELLKTGQGQSTARSSIDRDSDLSWQLLADPLIFLRRWIGEGFVSVLDTPAVMYVWDQCFMQGWRDSVLQNVCLALLELSRHRFMEARNYIQMKEVFLNEGCKLYTMDIQMAWIHVENGKHIMDIPFLNRQRPSTPGSRMSVSQSVTPGSGLPIFGIKRLQAKLIIPAEMIQRESWLTTLDPASLKLQCGVYFGSILLNTRISTQPPILMSADRDSYGNMVYRLNFTGERYVYGSFDLSQYDVERELGASPFAILSLEYHRPPASSAALPSTSDAKSPGVNLLPLGWSRVPLFRAGDLGGEGGDGEKFVLVDGETWVALHPGDIPDSLLSAAHPPPTPPTHAMEDAYLGYNSELGALVFDPNHEPRTPPPVHSQVPPIATQPPPAKKKPSPKPSPQPTPVSIRPTPKPDPDAFVDHDPNAANDPPPTSNREPFDVYIDAVRYIPDNATIVKVTGRVLKGGELTGLQDILAVPVMTSPARSPEFDFRLTINSGRQKANPDMLLMLRVYTVDIVTEQLVVIGSCLVNVFNINKKKEGVLRVGGHQYRLHSGMPNVKQGIANLKHTDLDLVPAIPACTLLLRILPTSEDPVPAPSYSSGYYQSSACQPSSSEMRILASYADHMRYPSTEADMVQRLQASEGTTVGSDENALLDWLLNRLDMKVQLPPSKPAENLSLTRCVRYRLRSGLRVKVNQAFGLPDERYVVVVAQVSSGGHTREMRAQEDGKGGNNPVYFTRLQADSYLSAPVFSTPAQSLFPFYDESSVLVLRLLSFSTAYRPTADNKIPGALIAANGSQMDVTPDNILGWTVLPLFDGNSVQTGRHHVPVMRGDIPGNVVDNMRNNPAQQVMANHNWDTAAKHTGASVSVTIWDGHYDFNDLPTVPDHYFMEEAIGDEDVCKSTRAAAARATGSKVSDLVLDNLSAKVKKQGVKGAVYQKEQGFFDQVADRTFTTLAENAFSQGVIHQM